MRANLQKRYVDNGWPAPLAGESETPELTNTTVGPHSPFGTTFPPVDASLLSYVHPKTIINH